MRVSEAIELLKLMPQDAHLVASTDGIAKGPPAGTIMLPRDAGGDPVLGGLCAANLRQEEYDIVLLKKENIAVLALVVAGNGNIMPFEAEEN